MKNDKLKDALKTLVNKHIDDIEITDNDLDGVAGGCNLLVACGAYSEPAPKKPIE